MHYDLVIIGAGSGNMIVGKEFKDLKVAIIEADRFGGTCLNYGCIPTKMFVHSADIARAVAGAADFGISAELKVVSWPQIRDRIFNRIDPLSASSKEYRESHPHSANVTVYTGRARFTGFKTLSVNDTEITATQIVIATGSRSVLPNLPGLDAVGALDNASVMRMEKLPESMIILGSQFIAAEMAAVFSALGVAVTVVARSEVMLSSQDADVARTFTALAAEQYDVKLNFQATSVERVDGKVHLHGPETLVAAEILVATGRVPNADTLDAHLSGIAISNGRIRVDKYQRVLDEKGEVIDGIFALGDVSSPYMLKHVANHEARVVRHNLLNTELIAANHKVVPMAIFANPQVARVGLTEAQAQAAGLDYRVGVQKYADIAYGWAMNDPVGFAKILIDARTTKILGCHIIGPQAASLVQVIVQAMTCGQTASDIARTQYWIHPAMTELVENALLNALANL